MSLIYPLQALVMGLLLIELMRLSANRLRLVDCPNDRKRHAGDIPLVGGIGIFGAVVISAIVVPGLSASYAFLFFPAALLLVIGLADDAWDIKPRVKFAGQILVAIWVLLAKPSLLITLATGEAIPITWSIASWLLTVTLIVGTVNAFNMIDGVDGLAGSLAAVALCWLAFASAASGQSDVTNMAVQVLAPVVAFLHFNARAPWRRRATVFLGDAGSLLLGFMVAILGLQLAGQPKVGWSAFALCFVIAVPAIDTLSLIIRRVHSRRSPFAADRQHIHHLLQQVGFSAAQTTTLLTSAAAVIGGLGFAMDFLGASSIALLGTLAAVFVAHLAFVSYLLGRIQVATKRGKRRSMVGDSPSPAPAFEGQRGPAGQR